MPKFEIKPSSNGGGSSSGTGKIEKSRSYDSSTKIIKSSEQPYVLDQNKSGQAKQAWNAPGKSVTFAGTYKDNQGRERKAYTSTRDNNAILGDYYGRLNNYFKSGNINLNDTREFRNEAQINMSQAYNPDDAKTWQDIMDYLDWSVYSDYQDQLNRLKASMEGYSTNLTNATNEYRSTQDMLAYQTDSTTAEYKDLFGKNQTAESRMKMAQGQYDRAVARQAELEDELSAYFMDRETWEARQRLKDNNYVGTERDLNLYATDPTALTNEKSQKEQDQARVDAFNRSLNINERFYNHEDKWRANTEATISDINSSIIGAFSDFNKVGLEFSKGVEREQFAVRNPADYQAKPASLEEAVRNKSGISNRIAILEQQEADIRRSSGGDSLHLNDEAYSAVAEIGKELRELKKQLQEYNDIINASGDGPTSLGYTLRNFSEDDFFGFFDRAQDHLDAETAAKIEKAMEGTGTIERFGMNLSRTMAEVGFDGMVQFVTGIPALASMYARVEGKASAEGRRILAARQANGEDVDTELLGINISAQNKASIYGHAMAGVELFTEKLTDGLGLIYGRGKATDITEKLIAALTDTPDGMNFLRFLADVNGEGGEEIISGLFEPALKCIVNGESLKHNYSELDTAELLYSYFLGAIMGLAGGGASAISGGYAEQNFARYQNDVQTDIDNAKKQAAIDKSTYREAEKYGTREDVEKVISDIEARPDTRSSITKAIQKFRSGEPITMKEASMLTAAGFNPGKVQSATRAGIDNRPVDKTSGKEGYLKRYAGSETEALGKQQSPQMGKGEQLSAEGEYHPEYQNDIELPSKKDLRPDEAPGIPESTPEEKQANREAGRKAEWLVKEAKKKGAKTSLVNMADTDWNRVAEAYEAATGEKLQHGRYKKQLKSFVDKQTGKTDVKAKKTDKKIEAPSVSTVEASQSAPASGGTDIAPTPAESVKPTPTPAPEAVAQVPPAKVDNKPVEVHNESAGKTVTSADLQEAVSRGIGELTELYNGADPESFANAYKEITGEDFDDFDASSSLREFYRQSLQAAPVEEASAPVDEAPVEPAPVPAEEDQQEEKKGEKPPVAEEQKQGEQKSAEPEPAKPAEEQKSEEKPKPEPKKKEPKPPKEKKPSVKEQRQAALAERGITAENIGLKIKDGSATRTDIEEVVAAGLLSKTAAGELIKARGGVGTAKSYADLLDAYENPIKEMTADEFREIATTISNGELKQLHRIGRVSDAVFTEVTGISWDSHKRGEEFDRWKQNPTTAEERAAKKAENETDKEGNPTDKAKLNNKNTPWEEIARILTRNRIRSKQYKFLFDALDPSSDANQTYYKGIDGYAGTKVNAEDGTEEAEIAKAKKDLEMPGAITQVVLDELVNQFGLSGVTEKNRQVAVERELERLRAITERNNKKAKATFSAKENFIKVINQQLDKLNIAKIKLEDVVKQLAYTLNTNAIKYGGDPVYNALEARYAFEEMSGIHIPMDVKTGQEVADFLSNYEEELATFMQNRMLGKMQAEQKQKAADKAELVKLMKEQAKDDRYNLQNESDKKDTVIFGKVIKKGANNNGRETKSPAGVLNYENAEERFREIALRRGGNEEEARNVFTAWKQDVDDLINRTGGRIPSWDDIPREYRRIAEKMLSGIEGNEKSKFPAITFVDMQNAKEPANFYGYVMMDNPDAGMVVLINIPSDSNANSTARNRGRVFLHEPFHYFSARYKQTHNGNTMPYESILLKISSKLAGENANIMDAMNLRNDIINAEADYCGVTTLRKFGINLTKSEKESFWGKELPEKFEFIDKKMQERFGDAKDEDGEYFVWEIAARKYWDNVYDETLANLTAGNTSVTDGSYDIDLARDVSREFFYNDGLIPRGFYENYEQDVYDLNKAHAEHLMNLRGEGLAGLPPMEEPRNAVDEHFRDLIAKSNRSAESIAYEIKNNPYGPQSFEYLTGFPMRFSDFEETTDFVQSAIEEYREDGYNKYMLQEEPDYTPEFKEAPAMPEYMREVGEDEETPKYAPSQEHTIAPRMYKGQKAEYGRAKHEVLTEEEIEKVANRYLKGALASKENLRQAVEWLDYRAGAMNPYELYMAQLLFSDTGDAISSLVNNRHPRNKAFRGYTLEELSEYNLLLKESIAGTKTPAAQIIRSKAKIPDTQQVRINAREAFFRGLESGEIDPNATDTKLEGMVEDYTYHIEKLDAEATHDVQKMLKLTKDIAYVRNNSAIFGVAGKSAQQIESFVLDYIAKHDPNAYDTLRQFALGSVNRISSDFQNVGVSATLGQVRYLNMLSNFATAVSNIGNNDISIFNEANAQNIGRALLGKYFEAVTGEEQVARDYTNSLNPNEIKANWNAMALGAAKGLMSLYYGLEVDESNSGKADYKIGAKFNQNTKVFGSQAFGRFLARMTFLSGIKMQVTDTAAKARTLRGMNAGVERMNLSDERKALMYTDNKNNADYRLFHEDSPINIAIGKIRKQLDSKLRLGNDEVGYLGLGTLMMPFVKVPINVATHALRATPVGSFVGMAQVARGMMKANRMHSRVLANQIATEDITDPAKWAKAKKELDSYTYRILEKNRGTDAIPNKFEKAVRLSGFENASEMSQEESASIIRKAGRVVTNTGLTLLGVLAAGLGAVKNFDDEDDDDMARLAKEHGLTGLQFNLSAVKEGRKDQWDFDNDIIVGGSWLEIASIPFVAGAEIWKDAQEAGKGKELEGALKSAAFSPVTSLVNVADILKDMPGLQQLNNIYEAIENSSRYNAGNFKEKAVDSTIQYAANQLASFMIPNSIAQLSAGLDNTVRDVYTTDDPLKTAANIIVNKTPFRNTIPARLTSTGEVRRYDDTTLRAVINKTILPGDFHRVTYSDLEKEWLAMSRAGATNVMPPASAPKKVTLEGEDYTLTADEKREWYKICTENTAALQSMIQGSPYWDQLSPEMQKKAFQDARKTAEHDATYMVKGDEANLIEAEYYDRWELNKNGDTGIAEFLPTKYYVKSMYDKDGNVSDYPAINKFIQNDYDKLDDETKVLLENSFHDLDAMDEAWDEAKMTAEEYYAAKAIYKEVSGKQGYKDAADIVNMHVEFDKLFSGDRKKAGWAEDHFTIFNQTPGDTRTKDKIIGNGYSLDLARQYINYNDQTSFSVGYDELQDHQKFNNVVKMKFGSEQERWNFFFDNVMPKQNTGQIKKLRKCMEAGDTLAEALEKVKDSEGNPLSTVYSKDADGNKYVT